VQLPGAVEIAQGPGGQCEIAHCGQGLGMVVAPYLPRAAEGLLVNLESLAILTSAEQIQPGLMQEPQPPLMLDIKALAVVCDREHMG
jgi:hypothetical protein